MSNFVLPSAALSQSGLRAQQIERLQAQILRHIEDNRYPGCQIALAQNGKLLLEQSFGQARAGRDATNDSLWLLYSNTKVIVAVGLWKLFEDGVFRFTDRVSDHLPAFAANGKRDITILQVITHQGGFPSSPMPEAAWSDHERMRALTSAFSLEWSPGSKVSYHGLSAHWVLASLIETWTGRDYRDYLNQSILAPLGLGGDLFVGLPEREDARVSDLFEPRADAPRGMAPLAENNTTAWRRAGVPGGGAYGNARGMAALYQMMLNGGKLNGAQFLSPRTLAYAIRNHTGDRVDEFMGMPMHRGLGPHLRGTTATVRGLGSSASPNTFGHGGVGTSYCWADPDSGLSFAYITNNRVPDPWHSQRLDQISNFVHSAIA